MKWFILSFLLSANAFAVPCDCEVVVFSPMTGSFKQSPNSLKTYTLEGYDSYRYKSQEGCRQSCLEKFHEDMPSDRLQALLLVYSQSLINERALGYNCTGLTTLKYPVRVKARLGRMRLGTVADQIEVVNHEEQCF